ncbi:MAG: glycosyltransferase family 2 protein [Ignavibacteria bacterium]|jgi:glycosyltransferase involved in cell wall biosynthesis|nr:glycosyltransferase family 2 protein [Ignavibacteria bacterium]MCU7500773.1 glycosyltransferase family 2 protein [Ignavibacteria bacterium]MCU7514283.1 glycosyltransferase family 2 protein [Ignavibacteria bacterium]MCU7522403.1 glycosyltransferase family 2 protein [Ignavibacteria bacterium]MCU7525584.1 glycosyltransferase family 2 protein [Ignavibacteria bacterium]
MTCAVIPFYNERNTIREIIERTLPYVDKIILVDDGSTDGTADMVEESERVLLIRNKVNSGKGYAVNMGFFKSIELGSRVTVTLDADLQHDPGCIPDFLSQTESYDIVIGNRLGDLSTMPKHRILSNLLTSFFLSKKTGVKILDSQSGFRAYRTEVLHKIIPGYKGFEAESEILVNASRENCTIGFVDIPTIYAGEKSKMRALQAISGFIKVLFM